MKEMLGIPLSSLNYPLERGLTHVRDVFDVLPPHMRARATRSGGVGSERWWWDRYGLSSTPYEDLKAIYTPSELVRLMLDAKVTNAITDHFREDCPKRGGSTTDFILWKIENSVWRWRYERLTYEQLCDIYEGLSRFSFGDGFEVTLDHSTALHCIQ